MAATITEKADADRYPNLETVVKKRDESVVGGQLNPTFVEWLMGFPRGWTTVSQPQTPKTTAMGGTDAKKEIEETGMAKASTITSQG